MTDHERPFGMPRRRLAVLVAVAVVVLAGVVTLVVSSLGRDTATAPTPGPTTGSVSAASPSPSGRSAAPTALPPSATASATGSASARSPRPSGQPTSAVPSSSQAAPTATGAPTVVPTKSVSTSKAPLRSKGELGNGVTVQVTRIQSVKGVARGLGEVAGPALRISITVDNQTSKAIPMDLALVNVYFGKDATPAAALSGPGAKPLSEPVAADKKSTGLYVFGVPKKQRQTVMVEFSYTTDAPTMIFTGSV